MSTTAQLILAVAGGFEIVLGALIVAKPEKLVNPALERKAPPEIRMRRWVRRGQLYISAGLIQTVIAVIR